MNTPKRIIDANANRAREALRVLEEAARFIVEDTELSQQLKTMRHDFTSAMKPFAEAILHRDTAGDVGTSLTTGGEQTREGVNDIILASGSRLAEALRSIEEYAKPGSEDPAAGQHLARTAEKLRYQGYDITKRLVLALGSGNARQWRLCLLLTESLCTHQAWDDVLEQALSNGVDAVQVREKELGDRALIDRVKKTRQIIGSRAALIVNDRPDIALLTGADGVHLGQADMSVMQARSLLGKDRLIGVSTSNLDEARQAKADGAGYCGVGPMFATSTKHKPVLAGPAYLRDYLAWDGLAHLAIGGITPGNIGELAEAGCRGVAVSSAICSAQDPGQAAADLSEALQIAKANAGG